jgi:hypothetical protein
MGCAVASAAMIGDLTYDEVVAYARSLDAERLRWPDELCTLLWSVTGTRWRYRTYWRRTQLQRYALPAWPVAVFIEDAAFRARVGQWVVVHRELVHDPEYSTAHLLYRYPRRDWHIASVAEPIRPAELAANHDHHRVQRLRTILAREGVNANLAELHL